MHARPRCLSMWRFSPPPSPTGGRMRLPTARSRRPKTASRRPSRYAKSRHPCEALARQSPSLVIGFAAETDNVIAYAQAKRVRKGCDWIVANDVGPGTGIFGWRQQSRSPDYGRMRSKIGRCWTNAKSVAGLPRALRRRSRGKPLNFAISGSTMRAIFLCPLCNGGFGRTRSRRRNGAELEILAGRAARRALRYCHRVA